MLVKRLVLYFALVTAGCVSTHAGKYRAWVGTKQLELPQLQQAPLLDSLSSRPTAWGLALTGLSAGVLPAVHQEAGLLPEQIEPQRYEQQQQGPSDRTQLQQHRWQQQEANQQQQQQQQQQQVLQQQQHQQDVDLRVWELQQGQQEHWQRRQQQQPQQHTLPERAEHPQQRILIDTKKQTVKSAAAKAETHQKSPPPSPAVKKPQALVQPVHQTKKSSAALAAAAAAPAAPAVLAEAATRVDYISQIESSTAIISEPKQDASFPSDSTQGAEVTLDGSKSKPERGQQITSYVWKVTSDTNASFQKAIKGADKQKVQVQFPPGTYSAELKVMAGADESVIDSVTFTVEEYVEPDTSSSGGDSSAAASTGSDTSPGSGTSARTTNPGTAGTTSSDGSSNSSDGGGSSSSDGGGSSSSSGDSSSSSSGGSSTAGGSSKPVSTVSTGGGAPSATGTGSSSSSSGSSSGTGSTAGPSVGSSSSASAATSPRSDGTTAAPTPSSSSSSGTTTTSGPAPTPTPTPAVAPAVTTPSYIQPPPPTSNTPTYTPTTPTYTPTTPTPVPATPTPTPTRTPDAAVSYPSPPPPPPSPPTAAAATPNTPGTATPSPPPPASQPTPSPAAAAGAAPVPPAGPTVDETYCNEYHDYDTAHKADDWDAMKMCCDDAKTANIIDSDCTSMPPRPADQTGPNLDYDNHTTVNNDYCDPSAFDLTQDKGKQGWNTCCDDAAKANVADKDCDNIKVR